MARFSHWVWLTAPLAWEAACKVNAGFARVTTIRVENGYVRFSRRYLELLGAAALLLQPERKYHRGELPEQCARIAAIGLSELVPTASTFGFLVDPSNPNAASEAADMLAAADMLGHKLMVLGAGTANEIDTAFVGATAQRVDALAVAAHAFLLAQNQQLVIWRSALSTIYAFRESAMAGAAC